MSHLTNTFSLNLNTPHFGVFHNIIDYFSQNDNLKDFNPQNLFGIGVLFTVRICV